MVKVWILIDDRVGSWRQSQGLGYALSNDVVEQKIELNKWGKWPNFLRFGPLKYIGIPSELKRALSSQSEPDIVIGSGRRLSPVLWWIKNKFPKTKTITIMAPDFGGIRNIDLVIMNRHDVRGSVSKNTIISEMAINQLSDKFLSDNKKEWMPKFKKLVKQPYLGVLIGGSTPGTIFTNEMADDFGEKINDLALKNNANIIMTNSRRTGDNQTKIILSKLTVPYYFHDYKSGEKNPIFGIYSCSDLLAVTGDSISMIGECATTKKPVFVYDNPDLIRDKNIKFLDGFYKNGWAISLINKTPKIKNKTKLILESDRLASIIKKRFKNVFV